eukprot:CAMPEP_0182917564 /NCGR_PEP_ID=MMETSP0105_2-20130417/1594_1 /TAXON_ID=81532 ORGANISM="Acanthoeca-like sp., Strain 10tr" /NCGR_SAMPLE_ID=MMETSP0105_2 /ASSEMBLY_ACC=CAM_ASM_000205 /LENGTH=172 /DNA_ID=CAMNT_0025054577 /DNA_START=19 /DNA_END=537 /DNA_ORIENTATION=+
MGKTPQQRRKLKTNRGKKPGLSRRAQRDSTPKRREQLAVVKNIKNPVVAAAWDVTKTRRKNFEDIGLVQNPNSGSAASKVVAGKRSLRTRQVPTEVVKQLEGMASAASGKKPVVASAGEVEFVDALVAKHGSDYKAMARDHKINIYQHTAKQIEHKIKRVNATLALAAQAEA